MGCCGSKEEDRFDGHEALLPKKGKEAQRFEQDMAQKATALGYKTPATATTAPVSNGKRPDEAVKPVALASTKPLAPQRQQPVDNPVVASVDLLGLNSDNAPSPSPSPVKPVAIAEQKAASPPKQKAVSPPKPTASRASDPSPTRPAHAEPSPPKSVSPAGNKSPVVAPPEEALVVSAFTLTDSTADAEDDNDDNENDNDETEEQQQQQAAAAPKKSGKSKSKRKKKKSKK